MTIDELIAAQEHADSLVAVGYTRAWREEAGLALQAAAPGEPTRQALAEYRRASSASYLARALSTLLNLRAAGVPTAKVEAARQRVEWAVARNQAARKVIAP